jgi:hypothetical protein
MRFQKLYISLGLIGALSLTACEKTIEVEPEFVKDGTQIYTNLDEYEFALTGAYALFRQTGYFGSGAQTTSTWANLPDMMTDNLVQTNEDLANWQNQVNWVYTTDESDIEIAWTAAYSVVAEANLVLRNIEQFSATNAKRVNRLKGQALALRGMVHFDVLRFWGVEYDRNSTALGIPYVSAVNIDNKPSRLTVKESWDNILKDMLEAETLLGDIDKTVNTSAKAYLDRTAVRALLARMYLYAKDYVKAEEYATKVIEAVPLASKTDFPGIWKDANTSEVLWSVAFNAGEGSPSSGVHNAPSNRNRFRQASPLEASYDATNDVRYASYFGSRLLSGVSRRIVTKFYGRGTAADNLVNWKALRTGEMYLIRAEARALQGGAKELAALADLNDLRAARITGYVPAVLAGEALQDAIALERQKELIGEGHRWFDLKRTKRTISRTDTELAATSKTLAPTAREWVWPIPQGEIDANANIKGQQSPGY